MPSASASIRNILPDIRPEQTVPSKTFINMTNPGGNSGIAMRKARGMPLPLIRNISYSKKRRKKLQASFCPVMPRTRAENSQTAGGSGTAGFKADHAAGWEGAKRERSVFRTRHRRERSGRAGRGYCCLCGNIRCRPGVGAGLHVDISGYIDIVKQDWRLHCRHTPRTVVCGQVREEQPSARNFK